ncbi:DDE transposase, partial [bacterium]|nr:DDE transposase [candidate division CSSED10-310 bacterium]
FDIFQGEGAVPPSATYSRFMRVLFSFAVEIDRIFDRLIEQLGTLLPDLGTHLAYDGKPLSRSRLLS